MQSLKVGTILTFKVDYVKDVFKNFQYNICVTRGLQNSIYEATKISATQYCLLAVLFY